MSRKFVPKRRPANGGGGPSLFPFLAVLLCTMGALIMLLVVVARNVREQVDTVAVVEAEPDDGDENILEKLTPEEAAEVLAQLQMGAEEAEWFAENLGSTKRATEKELEEQKTRLALLEKETQKVHDEIERISGLAEKLESNDGPVQEDLEKLKQVLEQRKKQREAAELELAELQKEAAQDAKSYAIIPYRGKSGTFRRPIYIECCGDKVIIQPEGVELYAADFIMSDRPDNPFDAVLRVIRQYYIENNQIVRGSEPYPLLIVRPSGVETYLDTRRAIGSWIKEYGYELIDEDWKIEYPQPSEELRERIEKQLATSRTRMAGYMAAMRAAGAAESHQREQYRLDHRGQLQRADGFAFSPGRSGRAAGRAAAPGMPDSASGGGVPRGTAGGMPGSSSGRAPGSMPGQLPGRSQGTASTGSPSSDISLSTEPGTGTLRPIEEEPMPESLKAQADKLGMTGSPQTASSGQIQGVQPQTAAPSSAYGQNMAGQTTTPPSGSTGMGMQGTEAAGQNGQMGAPQIGMTPPMNPNQEMPQKVTADIPSKTAERKENWALRGMTPFSAAISRPVKIQCAANMFVLLPQKGLARPRVIPITDSVFEATDKLVYEIWEYMDTWGIAGEKTFWRPVLEVTVPPGGEQRFKELQYLLRNSGLVVEQAQ